MTLLEKMVALVERVEQDNALTRKQMDRVLRELGQMSRTVDSLAHKLAWITRDDPPPEVLLGTLREDTQ